MKEDLIEMSVKFWEPYAVRIVAKDIDVFREIVSGLLDI